MRIIQETVVNIMKGGLAVCKQCTSHLKASQPGAGFNVTPLSDQPSVSGLPSAIEGLGFLLMDDNEAYKQNLSYNNFDKYVIILIISYTEYL